MATAHDIAADAARNTTMTPPPRFFTSMPPASAAAGRRIAQWVRRNSSALSGVRPDAISVEATMSVNNTVTFSLVIEEDPQTRSTTLTQAMRQHGEADVVQR